MIIFRNWRTIFSVIALMVAIGGAVLGVQSIRGYFHDIKQHKQDVIAERVNRQRALDSASMFFRDYRPNDYDQDLYRAAVRMAAGEVLTDLDIEAVKPKINQRVNEDMTLLFFAAVGVTKSQHGSPAYQAYLQSFGRLMRAGGSPYMEMHPIRGVTLAQAISDGTYDVAIDLMRAYVENGGDPNFSPGTTEVPIVNNTVLMQNFESYKLLVDHGADVFKYNKEQSPDFALMLAGYNKHHEFIDYAIDKGLLSNVGSSKIKDLIYTINSYELRSDDTSHDIVRITRRILAVTGYLGDEETAKILAFGKQHGW